MIHLSRIPKLAIPAHAAALLLGILLPHESCGEELSEILRQISEEKSGQTSEKKTTSAAAEPPPKKRAQPKKSQAAKPQAVQIPVAQPSRWIIYGPKDKLPNNLQGCAVAGDFKLIGEDAFGGALLVAADSSLFFARKFIVKNSSSGYAPGTIFPTEKHRIIRVPRERPLLFLGRDMLPGDYLVHAQ